MATPRHRVVIIGAGTGGLCLAHGLLRQGIDVAVFERDRTRRDGLHGYRVGISPDGSRALHACLPPELYATFVATCARAPRSLTFLDQRLRPLLAIGEADGLHVGTDPIDSEKSVSRMTLRQVLLTGLEGIVHFDRVFSRYEVRPDGTVEALFEDGTSVVGDLLVGADGSNSRVRQQLLPGAGVHDTGIIAIAGKVPLDDEARSLITPPLRDGVSLILGSRGYSVVSHTMEFGWDADHRPKQGIGRTEAELIERWPGALFDNTSDYFMWGFGGARKRLPVDPMPLRGADLIDLTLRLTSSWHPNLRRLFEKADPAATFPVAIRTSEPVAAWETGPVTVLGDAIHTMTPGRGVGANTALLDALLLARQLGEVDEGRLSQRQAVASYEESMREYGFEAVKASLQQMSSDDPIHHPVWGGPVSAGFKAMLRVSNVVPAMKRRMAWSETELRDRHRHAGLAAIGADLPRSGAAAEP